MLMSLSHPTGDPAGTEAFVFSSIWCRVWQALLRKRWKEPKSLQGDSVCKESGVGAGRETLQQFRRKLRNLRLR